MLSKTIVLLGAGTFSPGGRSRTEISMTRNEWVWVALKAAGIVMIARGIVACSTLAWHIRMALSESFAGESHLSKMFASMAITQAAIGLVYFAVGYYFLRGGSWVLAAVSAGPQPLAPDEGESSPAARAADDGAGAGPDNQPTRIDRRGWVWVAVKVFGVYLLAQMIITIPTLIGAVGKYLDQAKFSSRIADSVVDRTARDAFVAAFRIVLCAVGAVYFLRRGSLVMWLVFGRDRRQTAIDGC
jgi:hypothetical protein